jgi:peptidyl-dipeptidase Dcp
MAIRRPSTFVLSCSLFLVSACSEQDQTSQPPQPAAQTTSETVPADINNPFLTPSPLVYEYPPFDMIENEHYLPAFETGMAEQLAEIDAIVRQEAPPGFDNTIVALERSGRLLSRVSTVFSSMSGAHTNDEIKRIEAEISPRLAEHRDKIRLNRALFDRVHALYEQVDSLDLDAESKRLIEEIHRDYILAGAELGDAEQARLRAINTELAELQTEFRQNVLNEVNELAIVVDKREELAGLSDVEITGAADAAAERGLEGKYVIPLLNTTQQPALSSLENRALRERILETSLSRGSRSNDYDNREVLSRTGSLRAEKAALLGFANYAELALADQTARTVAAVNERLAALTPQAIANAQRETDDLEAKAREDDPDFELAAWDWDFYAEKLRQARYDFDDTELKPYFELDSVLINGVFFAAGQVYGLVFEERDDLPVYHEDVRVFEVFEEDGSHLAFFLFDPYARPSKRGGAWMNSYVGQSRLEGREPIVANHLNIPEPPPGEPTLLTFTEVTTMFHEFGHALHGMFSDVTYPYFSGTSVPRDFVEYPSQVNEMWATWPEVLANYARHYETGEPMPQELLDKVIEARQFNQGYATTEYLAATLVDQALHQLTADEVPSAEALMGFEAAALAEHEAALDAVPPRYRLPYFSHIMGGYAAGYYSYIWSEVLDADTVEWFKENGGMLRANGQAFREMLLSKGGSVDAMTMFREYRGRDPDMTPLLVRRGLQVVGE